MRQFREHRALARRRHDVELALREALANAIIHGNHKDRRKKVQVSVSGTDNGVSLVVSDEGEGFDYKKAPDPLEDTRLHSHHGRGLFLIRRLMDKVNFARGGREIRMWKAEAKQSGRRLRRRPIRRRFDQAVTSGERSALPRVSPEGNLAPRKR